MSAGDLALRRLIASAQWIEFAQAIEREQADYAQAKGYELRYALTRDASEDGVVYVFRIERAARG